MMRQGDLLNSLGQPGLPVGPVPSEVLDEFADEGDEKDKQKRRQFILDFVGCDDIEESRDE
jgi:hypothetical protein